MNRKKIKNISIASAMAALSIILELLSVRNEGSKISLYSLPLLFSGILFGPKIGLLAGFASGFISQVCLYGLSPTTIIWLVAPSLWGLLSGWLYHKLMHNHFSLWNIAIVVIAVSLSITGVNSLALYLDGLILHYPTPYIISMLGVRIFTALFLAIPYTAIIYLTLPRLSNYTFQKEIKKHVS